MKYFVYILLCSNGKYYVGHTKTVEKRLIRHLSGEGAKYTRQNKPQELLWEQDFNTELEAIRREKQIKGWSRIKKEKLTNGNWR